MLVLLSACVYVIHLSQDGHTWFTCTWWHVCCLSYVEPYLTAESLKLDLYGRLFCIYASEQGRYAGSYTIHLSKPKCNLANCHNTACFLSSWVTPGVVLVFLCEQSCYPSHGEMFGQLSQIGRSHFDPKNKLLGESIAVKWNIYSYFSSLQDPLSQVLRVMRLDVYPRCLTQGSFYIHPHPC